MGDILTRRRELILASGSQPEWDIDWDYTMGLPTANGWTRTDSSGSNASQTLRDNDVRIYVKNSSYNLIYSAGTNNSVGAIEVDFAHTNNYGVLLLFFGDGESSALGIRAQYNANYKGIYLFDSSGVATMTKIQSISQNTYYKVRLVTDGTYGYVYVNDSLKANQVDLSTISTSNYQTRCTITSTGSSNANYTTIKSLRAKFGRI